MIPRLRDEIQKLFFLTRSEANGYLVLLFIMAVLLLAPLTFDLFEPNNNLPSRAQLAKTDSLIAEWEKHVVDHPDSHPKEERNLKEKKVENPPKANSSTKTHVQKSPQKQRITPFDINLADTTTLQKIYGIGPVLSTRIVKFRDKLGGFYTTDQLYEVYGMDTSVTEQLIEKCFIADDFEVTKINLNEADFKTFVHHPYISYEQTKAIVNYRRKHEAFNRVDDLINNGLVDEATFEKIFLYLTL